MEYNCYDFLNKPFASNLNSYSFNLIQYITSPSGKNIYTDTDVRIIFTFSPPGILSKSGEILISGMEYPTTYIGVTYTPNNSTTGITVKISFII